MAKISADRVNLRAAADTNAEVVVQVDYGLQLDVLEVSPVGQVLAARSGPFLGARRPGLKEGRVARKVINVRAGSSENYSDRRELERNAEVQAVTTGSAGWASGLPPAPACGCSMSMWKRRLLPRSCRRRSWLSSTAAAATSPSSRGRERGAGRATGGRRASPPAASTSPASARRSQTGAAGRSGNPLDPHRGASGVFAHGGQT